MLQHVSRLASARVQLKRNRCMLRHAGRCLQCLRIARCNPYSTSLLQKLRTGATPRIHAAQPATAAAHLAAALSSVLSRRSRPASRNMETALHYDPSHKHLSFLLKEGVTAEPDIQMRFRGRLNTVTGGFEYHATAQKFISSGPAVKVQQGQQQAAAAAAAAACTHQTATAAAAAAAAGLADAAAASGAGAGRQQHQRR